ncbi:glycosyltransferase family 4 protein [Sphingomonas sp. GCM10030256]|uniref:glycosyltransferase family 4 protein n=1 Tax=Sphingomonas sp. GCM10030256 TaxID=3273427 RepID=UPI0036119E8D
MTERTRLFLTTDAVGGVWTYSLELASALVQHGVETVLATLGPPPSGGQRAEAARVPGLQLVETGLPLDWLASDATQLRIAAEALARLADEHCPDVVQLHSPALALGKFPAPVVGVVHSCVATWWAAVRGGALPADFRWRTDLLGEGMTCCDLLVTPTAAFGRAVQDAYGLRHAPIAVHNGRFVRPASGSEPAEAAFTAGRLWDEGKNVLAFDRAAQGSKVPFRAAGPTQGPNGAGVQLRHATALGNLPEAELAAALDERPIFVSTARYEPFGLAVLEAAQAGCTLVLSDILTFRELWDGVALFVRDEDIAAAVDQLIADREQRERLGAKARDRASRYTPQATAAAMLDLYRGLDQRRRAA